MDAEGVGGSGDRDGVNIGEGYAMVYAQRVQGPRKRRKRQMSVCGKKEERERRTYKSKRR